MRRSLMMERHRGRAPNRTPPDPKKPPERVTDLVKRSGLKVDEKGRVG